MIHGSACVSGTLLECWCSGLGVPAALAVKKMKPRDLPAMEMESILQAAAELPFLSLLKQLDDEAQGRCVLQSTDAAVVLGSSSAGILLRAKKLSSTIDDHKKQSGCYVAPCFRQVMESSEA